MSRVELEYLKGRVFKTGHMTSKGENIQTKPKTMIQKEYENWILADRDSNKKKVHYSQQEDGTVFCYLKKKRWIYIN